MNPETLIHPMIPILPIFELLKDCINLKATLNLKP